MVYYILTSNESFEKYFGKVADKKRKLYNGMIKCNIYQFEKKEIVVYAGWKTNQIFENGTLMDELITWNKRGAIEIGYTDEDNNVIEARIGSHNHITLKINNKIYNSKTS